MTHDAVIAQLRTMLALGSTEQQLDEWMKQHLDGVPRKTRVALERQARAEMLDAAGDGADWAHACSVQRLNDLYARALHIQDYKVCLSVEKELRAARRELAERTAPAATTPTGSSSEDDAPPSNVEAMWPGARANG